MLRTVASVLAAVTLLVGVIAPVAAQPASLTLGTGSRGGTYVVDDAVIATPL